MRVHICVCVPPWLQLHLHYLFLYLWFKALSLTTCYITCMLLLPTLSVPQSPILVASPNDYTSDSITVVWASGVTNELPVTHVVSVVDPDGNKVGRVTANANVGEASVSGLLADTEYHVTVWAENIIGRSNNHSILIRTREAGMYVVCEV